MYAKMHLHAFPPVVPTRLESSNIRIEACHCCLMLLLAEDESMKLPQDIHCLSLWHGYSRFGIFGPSSMDISFNHSKPNAHAIRYHLGMRLEHCTTTFFELWSVSGSPRRGR